MTQHKQLSWFNCSASASAAAVRELIQPVVVVGNTERYYESRQSKIMQTVIIIFHSLHGCSATS